MELLRDHLAHTLAVLLFVSRAGDVGSTYLLTPTLRLETNPIVRRLGWWWALASFAVCAVPYWSLELAVMLVVPFLLVSAANTAQVWAVRTMGEGEYHAYLLRLARKGSMVHALVGSVVSPGSSCSSAL